MDKLTVFPDKSLSNAGIISSKFLSLGIKTFHQACRYVQELPYGYNSNRDDLMILFKENKGTCTTKHAVIATCAGIYLLSFCQNRNLSTEDLGLIMTKEIDKDKKMIKRLNMEIQLPPDFPKKYEKAIVKAANQCSVKRHMIEPPEFQFNLSYKEGK